MRFFILMCLLSSNLFAHGLFLKMGPPSLGNGGPNPLGIPPKPIDMELTYVHQDFEMSVGVPALSLGWKILQSEWGGSIAAGPALVLSAHAGGIGAYSSFAYTSSKEGLAFIAEYKNYLGISSEGLIMPYSLRIGLGYVF
jgi:hypothetical protein